MPALKARHQYNSSVTASAHGSTIPALKARHQYNSSVTASAHGSTIPALKARQEYSPGQRPGNKASPEIPSPEGALHIHRNPCADTCLCISIVSPLQGSALVSSQNPGRCPGLYYHCPFRASGSRTIPCIACFEPKSGGCAWMQSATALAGWACTKMKVHPVGELSLLGKPGRLNDLCVCAALNCRF